MCRGLIRGAEQQDEDGAGAQRRVEALRRLCLMRPSETLNVRSMAVCILLLRYIARPTVNWWCFVSSVMHHKVRRPMDGR